MTMAGRTHLGHSVLSWDGLGLSGLIADIAASSFSESVGAKLATERCRVCGTRTLTFLAGQPNENGHAVSKRSELRPSLTLGWSVSRAERHSSRYCPATLSATRSVPIPRPADCGSCICRTPPPRRARVPAPENAPLALGAGHTPGASRKGCPE